LVAWQKKARSPWQEALRAAPDLLLAVCSGANVNSLQKANQAATRKFDILVANSIAEAINNGAFS